MNTGLSQEDLRSRNWTLAAANRRVWGGSRDQAGEFSRP